MGNTGYVSLLNINAGTAASVVLFASNKGGSETAGTVASSYFSRSFGSSAGAETAGTVAHSSSGGGGFSCSGGSFSAIA